MRISASKLRENIYNILDEVLDTGVPVEVIRKGKVVRITAEKRPATLARLRKRMYPLENAQSIVHLDWLHEWNSSI